MTQSIHQSLMFNVLRQVSLDRLQRAVAALVEKTTRITLTRTTAIEIRALVRNGEESEYGVTLRRFPGKVIPLYSAVHDKDANKGQNEGERTK